MTPDQFDEIRRDAVAAERERIIGILTSDKAQVWLPEAGDLWPATDNDLRKLFQP